ncbi:MAG: methylated-DNA--[protein]-cysteine S-methyltransferase [Candidatus Eisenbacteria bacterium]
MTLDISHLSLKTRIGDIWLAGSQKGIFCVNFGEIDVDSVEGFFRGRPGVTFRQGGRMVEQAGREILLFLEGKQKKPSVKLDLTGTTVFARKVWRATRKIPYGEVRTYAWVAEKLGYPNSARAVGGALGSNPVPIFIPCHRVIACDGHLGGFSGGVTIKKLLLALESGQSSLGLGLYETEE